MSSIYLSIGNTSTIGLDLIDLPSTNDLMISDLGSKIYRLGSSVLRTGPASPMEFPRFYYTLKADDDAVTVVQKNGLVTRMIKLFKIRGFSEDTANVLNVHVNLHKT